MTDDLKKILYVEDDPDIAEITLMTLQDLGDFTVKHCMSGQEALAVLPVYAPQLLIIDVMMPGMDGPETVEKMKLTPEGQDLPFLFMTAKAQTHEQAAYREKGALGVIVKPFDPMTLCDTIQRFWEKNETEKETQNHAKKDAQTA